MVAATGVGVADGDEVVLASGNYTLGAALTITKRIDMHGQAGQPRPHLISSSGPSALTFAQSAGGSRFADTELTVNAPGTALHPQGQTTIERVVSTSDGFTACLVGLDSGTVVRDSVCRDTAGTGSGINFNLTGGGSTLRIVHLRNVDALAAGSGDGIAVSANSGAQIAIEGKNVIAHGGAVDVATQTDSGGASATVTLDHSNFATQLETGTQATVTDPGSGTNQTAPPLLADLAGGDVHQLPGSPTIDAGIADPLLGTSDLDGDPRSLDATPACTGNAPVPDIGEDEFAALVPDCAPPDTAITKKPRKRTHRAKAKFRFSATEPGSSFQCKIDRKAFAPCSVPKAFRHLKHRKHSFQVRAIDPAGNVDATPARFRWRILPIH